MNPMGAFKLGVMKFNPQAASHHLLNRESQLLSFLKLGGWMVVGFNPVEKYAQVKLDHLPK